MFGVQVRFQYVIHTEKRKRDGGLSYLLTDKYIVREVRETEHRERGGGAVVERDTQNTEREVGELW